MAPVNVSSVAFTDPPVISVSLTVYFEPVEALQATHLSSLREAWRDDFPNVAELPPLRSRNRGGEEASLVPIGAWPCPYVMFTTAGDESSIAIQSDRFICSWAFPTGDAPSTYPGFQDIRARLVSHFTEFSETVRREVDRELTLTGSECDYLNLLDNNLSVEELMVGITTKWSTRVSHAVSAAVSYGGVRLHLCNDDDLLGCTVNIKLDVDNDDDGPVLGISSFFDLPSEGEDADLPLGGLDRAHDRLIATFLEYTSDEMQQSWGREPS